MGQEKKRETSLNTKWFLASLFSTEQNYHETEVDYTVPKSEEYGAVELLHGNLDPSRTFRKLPFFINEHASNGVLSLSSA